MAVIWTGSRHADGESVSRALAPSSDGIIFGGMFYLTRREQVVMILILVALAAGTGIRHFRMQRCLSHPVQVHP